MRRVFRCRFSVISPVVVAAALLLAASTGWTATVAPSQPTDPIAQQLDSKDPTQIAQAVAAIQQQLQATDNHAVRGTEVALTKGNHWLKKLMDAGDYSDVANLTVQATVAQPLASADEGLTEQASSRQIRTLPCFQSNL